VPGLVGRALQSDTPQPVLAVRALLVVGEPPEHLHMHLHMHLHQQLHLPQRSGPIRRCRPRR
jgi:hypothetical protein